MTLGFKDLFNQLTTWIFSGTIVTLHLSRLIAFQYYLDNLTIVVKKKFKSTIYKRKKKHLLIANKYSIQQTYRTKSIITGVGIVLQLENMSRSA